LYWHFRGKSPIFFLGQGKDIMSAPWTAPTADSPAAVGLKNGGLREITTDIIYPVSRAEKGSFQSGVQQEFRWRSDSSRYWLPRESRLYAEIEFAFGETALTGSGVQSNNFFAIGKKAPKTVPAGYVAGTEHSGGAPPNCNVALTAAPAHALFDQSRFVMNGVTVENQPNLYDTACAQLLTIHPPRRPAVSPPQSRSFCSARCLL
jgi:hypothetical protein